MDNASIHKKPEIQKLIEERGYKLAFLPPYSPFLNPIEEFWAKVKAGVRRSRLSTKDILSDRIKESSNLVTLSDLEGWVKHSVSFFERCLAGELNI